IPMVKHLTRLYDAAQAGFVRVAPGFLSGTLREQPAGFLGILFFGVPLAEPTPVKPSKKTGCLRRKESI
ncbi:hypothetical protein, partial [Oscillatoria sp. HE19RPO]|uniref:hypothetical protein n=1 Tax=Oscillatoria sp. HE19RPO TaxID=2954806 RepID=UPI0020C4830D